MNNYYVYIYWRLDTNEPFYVGKGKKYRWCCLHNRGKHFKNIANKYPIACEIIKDNLTNEEATGIECWLINELVFEYGYSIDIKNNYSNEKGCHLVNCTWGGEGTSGCNPWDRVDEDKREEWTEKIRSNTLLQWENMTEEDRKKRNKKIGEANRGRKMGENNYLYGKSPKDFMTDEQWEERNKKIGKANSGKNSSCAKSVICLTTKKVFYTIKQGSEYYNCSNSSIGKCCNGFSVERGRKVKIKYCGKLEDGTPLQWMWLDEFLNKCKYIIL